MIINIAFVLLLFIDFSVAGLLIKPEEVLKENFPKAKIIKKNILLTKSQARLVQNMSKVKLPHLVFTVYIAKENGKTVGYALLHTHKVRTRNEAVLITFDKNCNVKDVEIIAFYEPPEYIPSDKWRSNFIDKNKENLPVLRRNIPNITGVTLSARVLTDGVRQSIAICEVAIKGRF